jgi:hypothetical protein
VPHDPSLGKLQLVGMFNTGPLAAVIETRHEITVAK